MHLQVVCPASPEYCGCVQGVKDHAACQQLCEKTPNCNAVAFNRSLKDTKGQPMCFPKTISPATNIPPNANDSVDYLELCPTPPAPIHPPPPPPPPPVIPTDSPCQCDGEACVGSKVRLPCRPYFPASMHVALAGSCLALGTCSRT